MYSAVVEKYKQHFDAVPEGALLQNVFSSMKVQVTHYEEPYDAGLLSGASDFVGVKVPCMF